MAPAGIKLRLRKGDLELEIEVGTNVSEEQLKVIQQILEPFAATGGRRKRAEQQGESVYNKLKRAVLEIFQNGEWFTSADAREIYQDFYGEEIEITTCSTYLRRMEREGLLESRRGFRGRMVEYRVLKEKIVEGEKAEAIAYVSD